jgi:hypothetical protein
MKKIAPVNKKLNKVWVSRDQEIHKEKLRNIKPSLDLRAPPIFSHLEHKSKRERLLEGKLMLENWQTNTLKSKDPIEYCLKR